MKRLYIFTPVILALAVCFGTVGAQGNLVCAHNVPGCDQHLNFYAMCPQTTKFIVENPTEQPVTFSWEKDGSIQGISTVEKNGTAFFEVTTPGEVKLSHPGGELYAHSKDARCESPAPSSSPSPSPSPTPTPSPSVSPSPSSTPSATPTPEPSVSPSPSPSVEVIVPQAPPQTGRG